MNWNQARARQRAGVHKRSVFKPVGQPQVQAHDPTCTACGYVKCACARLPLPTPAMRDRGSPFVFQGMVDGMMYSYDRGKLIAWLQTGRRVWEVQTRARPVEVESFLRRVLS